MIPMILLENNAEAHQSGLCGGEGGRGDNDAPMVLSRWERLPSGTALFSQPDLEESSMVRV